MLQPLLSWLGVPKNKVSYTEQGLSALGGLIGIALVALISQFILADARAWPWLVASMGASAVLLFAIPHGPLSQPWSVFGGHVFSALIGVTCAQWFGQNAWSGAVAVAFAIAIMHQLRCIHPPGGATALTAVLGGDGISQLGYQFILTPVALNVFILLTVAVLFNYPWPWRRYPSILAVRTSPVPHHEPPPIAHAQLVTALSQIDAYLDISEQDLLHIYELATRQSSRPVAMTEHLLVPGHCYSNGRFGIEWEVRLIERIDSVFDQQNQNVYFRRIAGHGRRSRGQCSIPDFLRWVEYEVERDENTWRPVHPLSQC
jgi:CBS-domain-containing membrane protein